MRRTLTIVGLISLGGLSIGLYLLKAEVKVMERQLAALDRELLDEQKSLQVLKAEWSYLNQPERLQSLVARHGDRLQLRPVSPGQIGVLEALPRRQQVVRNRPDGAAQAVALPRPGFKPAPPRWLLLVGREARN